VEAVVQVFAQQPVPLQPEGGSAAGAVPFPLPAECALLTPPLLQRQARALRARRARCPSSGAATHALTHARLRTCASAHAQVWLRQADTDAETVNTSSPLQAACPAPLVYACSWWNAAAFSAAMPAAGSPIWRNLASTRTEAYRDLCTVYLGDNPALEAEFNAPGPFWGRHYVLYVGGAPLTVVYEVFGPRLREWLGHADGAAGAKATLARQAAAREALRT
jgi:hypothetical protein